MDSKKDIKQEVALALEALHKKLDFLKAKVDKLCEHTECFGEPTTKDTTNKEKKS